MFGLKNENLRKRTGLLALTLSLITVSGLLAACDSGTTATSLATTATSTTATSTTVAVPATTAASTTAAASTTSTAPTKAPDTVQPGAGQTVPFLEDRTDPVGLVKSFYNAINRKEYQRAYGYWGNAAGKGVENTPASYPQFVQGYADTASVAVTTGQTRSDAGAGQQYTSIPTVLMAKHPDGTSQTFYGCYVTHKTNPGIDPSDNGKYWTLQTGKIQTAPASSKTEDLLAQACQDATSPQAPAFYEERTEAVNLLKSYYNAINRKEYQRAYKYWESAGSGVNNTPPVYADFVKGYADTVSVNLTTGTPSSEGAAAGSTYITIPAVLVASQTNGTTQTFYGCYTTRKTNVGVDPNPDASKYWRLYTGEIQLAPAGSNTSTLLSQGCKTN